VHNSSGHTPLVQNPPVCVMQFVNFSLDLTFNKCVQNALNSVFILDQKGDGRTHLNDKFGY